MIISLVEARRFRRMNAEEIRCAHELCRHTKPNRVVYHNVSLPGNTYTDVIRCRRCLRWWLIGETVPPPGNPELSLFRKQCKHYRCRTLPGTDDKNQCLECDTVFDKSEIAIAWRRVRNVTSIVYGGIQGTIVTARRFLREHLRDTSGYTWEPPE